VKPRRRRPEEKILLETFLNLPATCEPSKERSAGREPWRLLRRLLAMVEDYPRREPAEVTRGSRASGLYDLDRVETVILRKLGRESFRSTRLDYGDEQYRRNSAQLLGESAPEEDGPTT